MPSSFPRLMIAGTSGDAGKTVVAVGLARAFARQGLLVKAFKKGPDYIDASWLAAATGKATRNLDTFLAAPEAVKRSFLIHAVRNGVNLIEGNRGFHDGLDAEGSHSSAVLSKLIECPVILVQDITKTTRGAAASVLGNQLLDEGVNLAGVILNRVAGVRHETVARASIEKCCGVPVLGAIPKLPETGRILMRHLGLITPDEEARIFELIEYLGSVAEKNLDLQALLEIARGAPDLADEEVRAPDPVSRTEKKVRICYLRDAALSFYYPDNLEALEREGAELLPVSALDAKALPPCDALYAGGGFPETHATVLADNRSFRKSVYGLAEAGLPIYGECGGLIYLADRLVWKGKTFPMAGVLPVSIEMEDRPQGHGYVRFTVDGENPFYEPGTEIRGHEFHYSRLSTLDSGSGALNLQDRGSIELKSVFRMTRGVGCGKGRDGLLRWNVLGTYLHVHALGCPAWARGLVGAAERHRAERHRKE